MKDSFTNFAATLLLALSITLVGCGGDNPTNDGGDDNGGGEPKVEIPAIYQDLPGTKIAEDQTWSNDTTLTGPHFVLPGATLTIEPGVTVTFTYHNGNTANVGTIITLPADDENYDTPQPSARLVAAGEPDQPIVFTSDRKEINAWGGIILAGRAPNNVPGGVGNIEGMDDEVQYGGDNNQDDSGILQYVRIEYSGYSIAEGSELQALTLYSVGSETVIDHINVYGVSDDGIEIFGGTVDLKYVVVYGADDDSFDYDQGWQGKGQFWLAVQKPGADQGFENDGCDDLSNCLGGNGPTNPTISNVTIYGAGDSPEKDNMGLKLRENLQGSYNNIIVSNFDGYHFVLDGMPAGASTDDDADETFENYPDLLDLNNFVLYKNGGWEVPADETRYATDYEVVNPEFSSPANFNFSLLPGSPALDGGTVPSDAFFDDVTFRGAFGTEDWTREGSWVRWPV